MSTGEIPFEYSHHIPHCSCPLEIMEHDLVGKIEYEAIANYEDGYMHIITHNDDCSRLAALQEGIDTNWKEQKDARKKQLDDELAAIDAKSMAEEQYLNLLNFVARAKGRI